MHLDMDKHILQDLGKLKGCYKINMVSGSENSGLVRKLHLTLILAVSSDILT